MSGQYSMVIFPLKNYSYRFLKINKLVYENLAYRDHDYSKLIVVERIIYQL